MVLCPKLHNLSITDIKHLSTERLFEAHPKSGNAERVDSSRPGLSPVFFFGHRRLGSTDSSSAVDIGRGGLGRGGLGLTDGQVRCRRYDEESESVNPFNVLRYQRPAV